MHYVCISMNYKYEWPVPKANTMYLQFDGEYRRTKCMKNIGLTQLCVALAI